MRYPEPIQIMTACISGVSKSMLGQIERCEVNPTVSTMWKIANGMKVSFTQFINPTNNDVQLIAFNQVPVLTEDEGRVRIFTIFPFDDLRRFEIYSLSFDADADLTTEPHLKGTQEFITVYSGELTIERKEKQYILKEGNSIRFKADTPHSYRNSGTSTCQVHMVIYYPNS